MTTDSRLTSGAGPHRLVHAVGVIASGWEQEKVTPNHRPLATSVCFIYPEMNLKAGRGLRQS